MSLVLKHNDTAVDLDAAHCELGSLVRSFLGPCTLTLRRAIAFDEPTDWQNHDAIALSRDGTTLFEGTITSSERTASADGEQIVYTCVGLRATADALTFQRTIDGATTARVVYNCPTEEQAEEAGYVAIAGTRSTVGEILADVLDTMAPDLAGVVGDGTAGSGYVQAELDALASVPGKMVLNALSVDEAITSLLRHAPHFGYTIDPATHTARFHDFRSLTPVDVAGVGDAVLRHQLDFATAACYSACTVQGTYEQVDVLEQLTPAWDSALEADWTSEKAAQYPDTYGTVWRLYATSEPVAEGGAVMPQRFAGGGDIVAVVSLGPLGSAVTVFTKAQVVDGTKLLLATLARQWNNDNQAYEAATVHARYTYRTQRVTGRFPATGHAGTAHTQRGLTRELFLVEEERGKKTLKGEVWHVINSTSFVAKFQLCLDGELAGLPIEFNSDGVTHTIAANSRGIVVLDDAPDTPLDVGDTFCVTVQDDTAKEYEGGTLSILEKYAKETLARVMDERFVGSVPLAGLDWSLALGHKVSFTDTHDPEYADLGATLVSVEHDLARQRTVLSLTSDRALGGGVTWDELERQRQRDYAIDEITIQIRRLWRSIRSRRAEEGHTGDPHEADDSGPYVGDDIWIDVTERQISHIGPGPVARTFGGDGQYIKWLTIDARGHVVNAGAGTFT